MNEPTEFQIEKWLSIYNREVRSRIATILKPFDLHESNFYYILIVIENPGVSQKVLTEYMRREQSIVTKAIKPLIREGWLALVKDPADKRQTQIYPTEKSLLVYPELKAAMAVVNQQATSGLSEDERIDLYRLIKKAAEHLKNEGE